MPEERDQARHRLVGVGRVGKGDIEGPRTQLPREAERVAAVDRTAILDDQRRDVRPQRLE